MAGGKKSSAVASKAPQSVKGNDVKNSKVQESVKPKLAMKSALASDSSDDDEPAATTELTVNQKFAKDYIDRKRKEELTQLERQRAYLENDDDDESDSETEDEDAEELTNELDNDIKKTLRLIRNRDPIIYDQSVAFFLPKEGDDDESDGSDSDSEMKLKKQKGKMKDAPLYYKDLVRQQVIAGDMDGSDDEDDDAKPRIMTYGEEQAQLKQDFLKSLQSEETNVTCGDEKDKDDEDDEEESDLEGGLFSVRAKSDAEKQQDDAEYEQFKSKYGSKMKKNEIDPEAFLENYLAGGWKEKKTEIPRYDEIVAEDEEDAEELEKMEDFEHAYNFRYEEEGSGLIQTYARTIDDSMRRKDDSRKRKREERKERKALERLKKEEELRRLKNLKQAELEKKLQKIAKLVGKTSEEDRLQAVLSKDLEGDFDPEEYDKRMQQIFDDQYYNEDDDEMDKPTWDDEEDKELFAGLPVDDEDEDEEVEKREVADEEEEFEEEEVEVEEEQEEANEEMDEETEEAEDADNSEEKAKKMTAAELQRAKQKYLDELYSLDYEDLIGDLKCRFKYREVRKNDFGLTAEEIMAADDKELKGLVSLKRLAPYMEEEYTINRRKVKNFKRSLEEKQAEEALKKKKKKTAEDVEENEDESAAAVEEAPTKKRKRTKKNKQQTAAESTTTSVVAADADVTNEKDDNAAAVAEAVEVDETDEKDENDEGEETKTTKESAQPQKKKSRRGGKKKKEVNPFAATGLSSSRLESYKLVKGSKK